MINDTQAQSLLEMARYCKSLKDIRCTRNEARLIIGVSLKRIGLSRGLAENICITVYDKPEREM